MIFADDFKKKKTFDYSIQDYHLENTVKRKYNWLSRKYFETTSYFSHYVAIAIHFDYEFHRSLISKGNKSIQLSGQSWKCRNFDSFDQAIKSLFVFDVSSPTSLADVAFWLDRSPKSSILQISSCTTNIDKYDALVYSTIDLFIDIYVDESFNHEDFLIGKSKYL